jgi:L-2,4-diaminobutyric acid acetyltransferase
MHADDDFVSIEQPTVGDGPALHGLAADSKVLDVNSRYYYLLWCRDYAESSVVARGPLGDVVGFITGYRRPTEPGTLLIWQVAVAESARGHGLAGRMLNGLYDRVAAQAPTDHLETTITPDNEASIALFTGFAKHRAARVDTAELFTAAQLGHAGEDAGHPPEIKYRIGPIPATLRSAP